MPPTDRNNADERRARIESLLEELQAHTKPRVEGVAGRTRASKKLRPAKAQIAPIARSRTRKKQ
jgi:hypothetical protein